MFNFFQKDLACFGFVEPCDRLQLFSALGHLVLERGFLVFQAFLLVDNTGMLTLEHLLLFHQAFQLTIDQ